MERSLVRHGTVRAVTIALLAFTSISIAHAAPDAAPPSAATEPGQDVGAGIKFEVEKYKLANGLTVILHEDHSAPIVSYQTWFKVGSKNEEPGYTGIAHLFEHMMFKGAKRYSGEEFDQILQANGATNNAFTTHDYTGYYENMPGSKLELVADIESDRMESLRVTAENLKSEREVVKEERRFRVDNSPIGVLREAIFGTAFKVHPYKWPVIGYMEDIDRITLEKANEFFHTYYAPNNATLVIVGDFNSGKAHEIIEKYYGHIASHDIPNKPRAAEPMQQGQRIANVERDVQSSMFAVAFHTPKAGETESYALDLLANILGFGESSRLHQRLVYKDQQAVAAQSYNFTLQDSGLLQVFITLKPGVNPMKVQRSVYGEIWRLRNTPVSAAELQKAKNQTMKSYVDSLKTAHGKGEALAMNETLFGDYGRLFTDLDQYNKVTAADIRKVAQKYLSPEKSTLVYLRPKAGTAKAKAHAGKSKPAATEAE